MEAPRKYRFTASALLQIAAILLTIGYAYVPFLSGKGDGSRMSPLRCAGEHRKCCCSQERVAGGTCCCSVKERMERDEDGGNAARNDVFCSPPSCGSAGNQIVPFLIKFDGLRSPESALPFRGSSKAVYGSLSSTMLVRYIEPPDPPPEAAWFT